MHFHTVTIFNALPAELATDLHEPKASYFSNLSPKRFKVFVIQCHELDRFFIVGQVMASSNHSHDQRRVRRHENHIRCQQNKRDFKLVFQRFAKDS